ncbi:MAG: hypothetical protein E2576_11190 [Alcaligenaceae bacterium]|nr:hypothetical protein [Alcaligenaceae bacterium SAGV5]MPS51227.1 hypothetical protein [Alcaligenaceae bacterium SAGV3]MPT57276.1 hypothetical protein [Alcaligenaceae bacterium]
MASDDIETLPALVSYLRNEADFNRSWTDGRRGGPVNPSEGYVVRRLELAARSDGWADSVQALIDSAARPAQDEREAFETQYEADWNDPAMSFERDGFSKGWKAAMKAQAAPSDVSAALDTRNFANAAGIVASDAPGTVARKLDAAPHAGHVITPPASAPQAPQAVRRTDAQLVANSPAVNEALEAFSHDSTWDNAVALVQTVLDAQAPGTTGSDVQLTIGIAATDRGATISIMQQRADGALTILYSGTHPLGDSMARATVKAPAANGDASDAAKYRALHTPEIANFLSGVENEALHQRERWCTSGDAGKSDADWFWLIGYLAGKAIRPDASVEKRLHHIITTAAACLNWHAARVGTYLDMRPGIEGDAATLRAAGSDHD